MAIRALPAEVVAQIAAGEVVERPVSVVKELLENSLDAGAGTIHIEVQGGGQRLIEVADDGCGIGSADVELAFGRHTTSKLRSPEDLFCIRTLGFRGEALASIAAVARVTMTTRSRDESSGTVVRLEGGQLVRRERCARPPGTTVTVENLFYNLPARRKFLRSDVTEAGHILALTVAYALAYAHVRFLLVHNGREVLRSSGTGDPLNALAEVMGPDVARAMTPLPASGGPVGISGYVGAPSLHRGTRDALFFYVNGRWVQDRTLAYAVEEAYRSLLPGGRHPVAVVHLRVDPADVDVNIHPTKREVRFRQGRDVFAVVQRAVRHALVEHAPLPQVENLRTEGATIAPEDRARPLHIGREAQAELAQLGLELGRVAPPFSPGPAPAASRVGGSRLPPLRLLGQVAQTYILAEGPDGLYLIDQHAAHERILYERLRALRASLAVPMQTLLEPRPIELTQYQARVLEAREESIRRLGFDIAPFGGTTFLVRAVPAAFPPQEIPNVLAELLQTTQERGGGYDWEERALVAVVCHAALRARQVLTEQEMSDLVRQLEETELPYTCPHGRPTLVQMTLAQLERQFGRR
ncbi:MAG: DNA mismatch repair endonuclease MutL [Anaerolineae bacterium]|nr:DNA mismatch repair endonuclease MutL [Anaerolineae bacterium]